MCERDRDRQWRETEIEGVCERQRDREMREESV